MSLKYQRVRPLKFSFLFVVLEMRHLKEVGVECVNAVVACWNTKFTQVTPP